MTTPSLRLRRRQSNTSTADAIETFGQAKRHSNTQRLDSRPACHSMTSSGLSISRPGNGWAIRNGRNTSDPKRYSARRRTGTYKPRKRRTTRARGHTTGDGRAEPRKQQMTISRSTDAVLLAVQQCWPTTPIDRRDSAGVWSHALDRLTANQIQHGIKMLSLMTDAFPPTPGHFRRLCQEYRAEPPSEPLRLRDNSSKGIAWRACQAAYARRLTGMTLAEAPATEFDVSSVVGGAPVPRSAALADHVHCWDAMKRRFEEKWLAEGVR